jgi:N-acetylneuraminate 9-O-acetyltransferase
MWIGHRRLNDDTRLLFLKVAVCSVLVTLVLSSNGIARWSFSVLKSVFNIQWNSGAWNGRVQESMYVPYWGMLLAIANQRMKKGLPSYLRYSLASCGLVAVLTFVIGVMFGLKGNNQYSVYHPFIAVLPIVTFIAFRNISKTARNYSSRAMIWVGRCSLELYILQGHLWVAADYNGILIIPGLSGEPTARGRIKSLMITIPIFMWISSQAATATGNLVKIILPDASSAPRPAAASKRHVEKDVNDEEDIDPLLEVADAIPLDGYHIGYSDYKDKKRSTWTFFALPQVRTLILLLCFWGLNLSFPRQTFTPIPDGFTPHRAHNA